MGLPFFAEAPFELETELFHQPHGRFIVWIDIRKNSSQTKIGKTKVDGGMDCLARQPSPPIIGA